MQRNCMERNVSKNVCICKQSESQYPESNHSSQRPLYTFLTGFSKATIPGY